MDRNPIYGFITWNRGDADIRDAEDPIITQQHIHLAVAVNKNGFAGNRIECHGTDAGFTESTHT